MFLARSYRNVFSFLFLLIFFQIGCASYSGTVLPGSAGESPIISQPQRVVPMRAIALVMAGPSSATSSETNRLVQENVLAALTKRFSTVPGLRFDSYALKGFEADTPVSSKIFWTQLATTLKMDGILRIEYELYRDPDMLHKAW